MPNTGDNLWMIRDWRTIRTHRDLAAAFTNLLTEEDDFYRTSRRMEIKQQTGLSLATQIKADILWKCSQKSIG